MKITKTADRVNYLKSQKVIANKGCDICPCCGENKSHWEYMKNNIFNKGIVSDICRTWCGGGLFKDIHYKVDCYYCLSCGAEWESDKYEYV